MALVNVNMLQSAIGEVNQTIQAAVAEVERKIMASLEGAMNTQRESLKEGIANDVMEFHSSALERIDTAVTAAIADQANRVDAMFAAAAANFQEEQRQVRELVGTLEAKLLALQDGNLERVAARLVEMETTEKTRIEVLTGMHESFATAQLQRLKSHETEIVRVGHSLTATIAESDNRLRVLEEAVGGGRIASSTTGPGDASTRAPRLRIPDPNNWGFKVLKGRDDNFHDWREEFENQIGACWMGLDNLLKVLRDGKEIRTDDEFRVALEEAGVTIPMGSNAADWDRTFVARKLHGIMMPYLGEDPKRVTKLCEKDGFLAYTMLNEAYDPVTADTEANLLERILKLGSWKVKGVDEEYALLQEAEARLKELVRRVPNTNIEAQEKMVAGMMFGNALGESTRRHILMKGDGSRSDFKMMQACVKELKKLEDKARPQKMDVSSAVQLEYSHQQWVEWMEQGYPDEEAAPAWTEEAPSLDALGKAGGKGGKGWKGKGKGKGGWQGNWKGKGKGKGKDDGGKGQTTWVETRACHNCGETGHLAWQCRKEKKVRSANSVESQPQQASAAPAAPAPSGTFASLFELPRRTARPVETMVNLEIESNNYFKALEDCVQEYPDIGATSELKMEKKNKVGRMPHGLSQSAKKICTTQRKEEDHVAADCKKETLPKNVERANIRLLQWSGHVDDESIPDYVPESVMSDDHPELAGMPSWGDEDGVNAHLIRKVCGPGFRDLGSKPTKSGSRSVVTAVEKTTYNKPEAHVNIQVDEDSRFRGPRLAHTSTNIEAAIATGDGDCDYGCCCGPSKMLTNKRSRDRQRQKKAKKERREAGSKLTPPEVHPWSAEVMQSARQKYEMFHDLPTDTSTIEQVIDTSLGVEGWAACDVEDWEKLVKVGSEVHPVKLCGLWLREALLAAHQAPEWERIVLTVDSGASDTVIPPHVAKSLPLLDSSKVGIEYEVANGGIVQNLGERRGEVKLSENAVKSFIMSFQVVEKVHKPLLAVSRLVEAGHEVSFNKANPRIVLSNGDVVPMICRGGTYEIDIWIKNPGFTRQQGK